METMWLGGAYAEDAALTALAARFRAAFADDAELGELSEAAQRILAVGAALFSRFGSAAVSVRELTRTCGLTPGALYNHFASRDDLLYTLVRNGHDRTERLITTALARTVDPRAALGSYVEAYIAVHIRFPEHAQLVHREYVHLDGPRRDEILASRRRMRDRLVKIVRDGQSQGIFSLIGGRHAAVAHTVMILDMCGRTSEWFNPAQASPELTGRYVQAALRIVGATEA